MKKTLTLLIISLAFTWSLTYAQSDSVLVDSRDGKVYKIVQIGSQIWTAQNMNYASVISSTRELDRKLHTFLSEKPWTKNDSIIRNFMNKHRQNLENLFFCYMDSLENCEKYGVLYTWESAQNACPADWHLPSKQEYEDLFAHFQSDRKKAFSALNAGGSSGFESLLGGESFGFDFGL